MNSEQANSRYEETLARRAEKLARTEQTKIHGDIFATVALIELGQETIGISVDGIREILKAPPITSLPWMPPWMMGIVQVRGELISVVDLSNWFNTVATAQEGFLVVVQGKSSTLGLFADNLLGFKHVMTSDIAKSFSSSEVGRGQYIKATTKDLISIMYLTEFLLDERLIINQSSSKTDPKSE